MKSFVINWVNYIYVHLFKRKYIFTVVLSFNPFRRFDKISTNKEQLMVLSKGVNYTKTKYKVILTNKLLIK